MSFGPSGSGGSGSNPNTAQVYLPANQPAADASFWSNINALQNSTNAGNTPGQWAWPQAQTAAGNIVNNPYYNQAVSGSQAGAATGIPLGYQGADVGSQELSTAAYNLGQNQSQNLFNAANNLLGENQYLTNQGQQLFGLGNQAFAFGQQALPYGQQILSSGFDPQQSLYNTQLANAQNTQNAVNAMSGIAGTPYGAGVTGQALQTFNQNWLNQELARQSQAASGYGALAGGIGSAFGTGASLYGQGGNLYGQGAGISNTAGNIYNQGGNLYSQLANLASQGGALGSTGVNLLAQSGALPANAVNALNNQSLGALGQGISIGNQQYAIPQQLISDLMQYMGLGQSASQLSGQLGQQGVNQLYQGLAGVGTGIGLAGGLGGLGNLVGSTGTSTAGLLGAGDLGSSLLDAGSAAQDFSGASSSGLLGLLSGLFGA